MTLLQQIKETLIAEFQTTNFQLIDERGDLKHLKLKINVLNTSLQNLSRLNQHKVIYKILDKFFQSKQIHALKINIISQ